ncbi:uncharacterized protein BDR25DRAFT_352648 [Lindgomyces ingoldianus]|uniref:Uncharacterized protein n=1 Tax=Lindgomyces ingoldianus TaxID=673940 RepID=A0ACB6R1K7_9PLEO|nr:uncharacterized protein BDR25DRAFT_352648 [Lindgomyces ingoldianus]KAF2473209.1 hypothetical protein BDR25DRAFT_352648 [Lindgomyces ingoldianus]
MESMALNYENLVDYACFYDPIKDVQVGPANQEPRDVSQPGRLVESLRRNILSYRVSITLKMLQKPQTRIILSGAMRRACFFGVCAAQPLLLLLQKERPTLTQEVHTNSAHPLFFSNSVGETIQWCRWHLTTVALSSCAALWDPPKWFLPKLTKDIDVTVPHPFVPIPRYPSCDDDLKRFTSIHWMFLVFELYLINWLFLYNICSNQGFTATINSLQPTSATYIGARKASFRIKSSVLVVTEFVQGREDEQYSKRFKAI